MEAYSAFLGLKELGPKGQEHLPLKCGAILTWLLVFCNILIEKGETGGPLCLKVLSTTWLKIRVFWLPNLSTLLPTIAKNPTFSSSQASERLQLSLVSFSCCHRSLSHRDTDQGTARPRRYSLLASPSWKLTLFWVSKSHWFRTTSPR